MTMTRLPQDIAHGLAEIERELERFEALDREAEDAITRVRELVEELRRAHDNPG